MGGRRLALCCPGQREKQRQRIVEQMGRDRENEPHERRDIPQPGAPRLQSETKESTEHTGEQGGSPEPKECIARTELRTVWREAVLCVPLYAVYMSVGPVKTESCAP